MKSQTMVTARNASLPRKRMALAGLAAGLLFFAIPPIASGGMGQNTYPHLPPELNRIPDSNQANDINDQQKKKDNFDAANAERRKQIASDSSKLLKLAIELKAEVDKTNKDTLNLKVVRKADEIEKLAHSVKEKMQLTVGAA